MIPALWAGLAILLAGTAGRGQARAEVGAIRTLVPGTVTVAVTTASPSSPYDPQLWIRRYLERFAEQQHMALAWVVVPFDQSWLRASRNEVDLVATNVASFPDRVHAGATFSEPFLLERRALRVRPQDRERYAQIGDFVGRRVGVVRGTAAERDVQRRAPEGVQVVATHTFGELHGLFESGGLEAMAEAELYTLDGRVIPSHGPEVVLVDLHDLVPGQREESVFVVRDLSTNLLSALNRFIVRTPFPP
jgi:ABC-type amino acid transport substrate-binding protein